MINVKSIFRKSALVVIIAFSVNTLFAYENEVKDRFEKTFKVSETDKLVLSMYDSDLQINTWANNEIKLTGEILISGGDKDDVEKLLSAFKNPEVNRGAGTIEINTRFSTGTIMIMGFYKKIKMTNGESVSVSSYKASYTIWIPEKIAFNLNSKYNSVKASSLVGNLDFQLYNVNLDMGDFGDNSSFDVKYSTVNVGKGKDAKFQLYDTKFYVAELNKVIVDSKYSNFTCKSVNLLVAESYDDTYAIDNLRGIDIDAKYTTLKAKGNSNLGKFKLYDCNVEVDDFVKIEYDSKYSEFNANIVGTLAIKSSYDDLYRIKEVSDISCQESNYNKVNIGIVKGSINFSNTYDSEIRVEKIDPSFTSFKGDFKYGSVNLKADPTLNYILKCDNTYGEINYPKERFKNKPIIYIEKDGKTQLESSTDPNAKCEINFTSYDMIFTIE